MTKYRKKPIVIDAFCLGRDPWPDWAMDLLTRNKVQIFEYELSPGPGFDYAEIRTPEGVMRGNHGDYLIRGIRGEVYPCKPDIFEETYEPYEEEE